MLVRTVISFEAELGKHSWPGSCGSGQYAVLLVVEEYEPQSLSSLLCDLLHMAVYHMDICDIKATKRKRLLARWVPIASNVIMYT